jgi:hypothetical protein
MWIGIVFKLIQIRIPDPDWHHNRTSDPDPDRLKTKPIHNTGLHIPSTAAPTATWPSPPTTRTAAASHWSARTTATSHWSTWTAATSHWSTWTAAATHWSAAHGRTAPGWEATAAGRKASSAIHLIIQLMDLHYENTNIF